MTLTWKHVAWGLVLIVSLLAPAGAYGQAGPGIDWAITLSVSRVGERIADLSTVGVAADAREDGDQHDAPNPPPIPDFVGSIDLYFPHLDWAVQPDLYNQDIRPPAATLVWDFEIRSSAAGGAVLSWDTSTAPAQYEVIRLEDPVNAAVLVENMRVTGQYSYTAAAQIPRKFRLVVASSTGTVPTPTPAVVPPPTPTPVVTPFPTALPTVSPTPVVTPAPGATATPIPPLTATPRPAATPAPTNAPSEGTPSPGGAPPSELVALEEAVKRIERMTAKEAAKALKAMAPEKAAAIMKMLSPEMAFDIRMKMALPVETPASSTMMTGVVLSLSLMGGADNAPAMVLYLLAY